MQTVEKFSLKLAVKNKDSCLSLCTPLCFSHPVLLWTWGTGKPRVSRSPSSLFSSALTHASWTCDEQVCCQDKLHRTREFNRAGTTPGAGWRQRLGMASTWTLITSLSTSCLLGTHVLLCPEWRMVWKIRKRVKGHKYKKILFLLYFGGGWWGQKYLSILDVSRWFMHFLKPQFYI